MAIIIIYYQKINRPNHLNASIYIDNIYHTKMTFIVLIDKTGTITEKNVKDWDVSELYKKAGFKNPDKFVKQHTWSTIKTNDGVFHEIHLYGKTVGNHGKENKYDFPPPVDSALYFGTTILVHTSENGANVLNLRKKDWLSIYNTLMGGFDDLNGSDEEDEEDEIVDPAELTKQGYKRDDFVVDDDEQELEYESELSEEEYFE